MKKIFIHISFGIFIFLLTATIANAKSERSFGGKIINTESLEIVETKAAGYDCSIPPGKTTQIRTKNGSFGYFIPERVKSATRNELASNQGIIGVKTGGTTRITCTKKDKDGNSSEKIISLKEIGFYGNSAK